VRPKSGRIGTELMEEFGKSGRVGTELMEEFGKSDRVGTELMEEFGKSGGVVRSPATCLPVHVPSPTESAPSSWKSSASPVASSARRRRASPCTSQVRPRRHRAHGGVRQVRWRRPLPGNVPPRARPKSDRVGTELMEEFGKSGGCQYDLLRSVLAPATCLAVQSASKSDLESATSQEARAFLSSTSWRQAKTRYASVAPRSPRAEERAAPGSAVGLEDYNGRPSPPPAPRRRTFS